MVYTPLVVSAIVLIGPTEALPALRAQLADVTTSLQMFTDHEVREAVEYIATTRPAIVAVEEVFAVSPRGEALVGRIMDDPGLSSCEIRILAFGATIGDKSRRKSGTGIAPAVAVAPEPAAGAGTQAPRKVFDRRGTRRAERFRMLQGVFGAPLIPLAQAQLLDINPTERHGQAMAIFGAGTLLGPILGPTLGGWLTDNFSWRWCFFINLPLGIIALVGAWLFISGERTEQRKRFDSGVDPWPLIADGDEHPTELPGGATAPELAAWTALDPSTPDLLARARALVG